MKLTVFGASGGVGRLVVQQALAGGHDVTAVVRNPGRLPVAPAEGLQVATVLDVLDPVTLVPALTGRDAVISAIGPAGNKQARTGPIAGPAARSIVRAMDQAGVSRIAAISAAPVGPPAHDENVFVRALVLPLLRRLLSDLYADLADQEAALAASGTDWTVWSGRRCCSTSRTPAPTGGPSARTSGSAAPSRAPTSPTRCWPAWTTRRRSARRSASPPEPAARRP
jgi:uncharacterized protein YbjT (DUF2867 family)